MALPGTGSPCIIERLELFSIFGSDGKLKLSKDAPINSLEHWLKRLLLELSLMFLSTFFGGIACSRDKVLAISSEGCSQTKPSIKL